MLKVLIVDDEFIVRAGLIHCIDWAQLGLQLAGEASNGKEALELILKDTPDIILLDLAMPVMNGLELIEVLAEKEIRTKIIVLSCHEDYHYMRQAIKYGICDYILKLSSTPDEITHALLEAVQLILKDQFAAAAEDFGIRRINSTAEHSALLPDKASYLLVLFHLPDSGNDDTNILLNLCRDWMDRNGLRSSGTSLNCLEGTTPFLLISPADEKMELPDSQLSKQLDNLWKHLTQYVPDSLMIGVSCLNPPAVVWTKALQQARKAFEVLFYDESKHLAFYSQYAKGKGDYDSKPQETALLVLIEHLNRQRYKEAAQCLNDYYHRLGAQARILPSCLKLDAIDIVNGLNNYLQIFSCSISDIDEEYLYFYQQIAATLRFSQLKSYMLQFITSCCSFLQNQDRKGLRFDILEAVDFMKRNYDKDITLSDVADHVNISKNHLSTLFKKETGYNFSDYLNIIRIEKAKQFLVSSPCHKISQIADMAGFHDTGYFSKVFKKITGLSPYEYRRKTEYE